jgi:hypothetical protein
MPLVLPTAFFRDQPLSVASLITWSRLEALPSTPDFEPGLEARVADPLWFLARQWQLNEFQGEDAGTPVEVRLQGDLARLSRFLPGKAGPDAESRATDFAALDAPLEVTIEAEQIRSLHARLAAEAGLHFIRMLAAVGAAEVTPLYREKYPLHVAEPDPADLGSIAWTKIWRGRAFDGNKLAADARPLAGADFEITTLPADPAVPAAQQDAVKEALSRWLRWYDEFIDEPMGPATAWIPERLEYAAALTTQFGETNVALTAEEYTSGDIDWYSFRAAATPTLGPPSNPTPSEAKQFRPILPALARFPGMPADRFWEFEDSRVYLGKLEAGPTDLSRMLVAEFALVYGNDWFLVPLDLPVGSMFRVTDLRVRDTFGLETTILATRNVVAPNWTIFTLTPSDDLPQNLREFLFLAPSIPLKLQGDPIEQVALFRDEMANLVWAVERKVQGASGDAFDRDRETDRVLPPAQVQLSGINADLLYRLTTSVPKNWIPFVPVPAAPGQPANAFAIRLERAALNRHSESGDVLIHPRGVLLRTDPTIGPEEEKPLRIEEEEVPREGIVVERTFQFTRWLDGTRHLWLGRRKRVGKGEGSSGLRFDLSEPIHR